MSGALDWLAVGDVAEERTADGLAILGGAAARLDRKSTRLNSSHSQISYAVFCLKKKKQAAHYARTAARRRLRKGGQLPPCYRCTTAPSRSRPRVLTFSAGCYSVRSRRTAWSLSD